MKKQEGRVGFTEEQRGEDWDLLKNRGE